MLSIELYYCGVLTSAHKTTKLIVLEVHLSENLYRVLSRNTKDYNTKNQLCGATSGQF